MRRTLRNAMKWKFKSTEVNEKAMNVKKVLKRPRFP